jgi:hypothetical protein
VADRVHVNICLEEHKLCLLVIIGVRADGRKELVALADGYRESTGSWADLLRDCKRRGMTAPVLAIGDGRTRVLGARCADVSLLRCWARMRAIRLSQRSEHLTTTEFSERYQLVVTVRQIPSRHLRAAR